MVEKKLCGYLKSLMEERGWAGEKISVRARALSPEEAIGTPEDDDYPLMKGRERLMEAVFKGARGQAFTDMFGDFDGSLEDIANMDLKNNFKRAVFIATLNAVMRHAGLAERTVHCKDRDPAECSRKLPDYLRKFGPIHKVALVGLQPRLLESLVRHFDVKVIDRDEDNIGKSKCGIRIEPPEKAGEHIRWCDAAFVTGTTAANGTLERFSNTGKPTIFYGVTVAGTASVLGLDRFCPLGS